MPDLDPLPGRPRVPDFTPRTGDYAAVVGRAKNRRRRHLTTASAGAAGVAVVVALSVGGGAGSFGLQPVQPAVPGASAVPSSSPEESPSPEPAEPSATAEPGEPGEPGGSPAAPGGSAPAGEPDPEPEPEPSGVVIDDGPYDGEHPPPAARQPVFVRDTVPHNTTDDCFEAATVAATGWCLRYDGPARATIGQPYDYRVLACRPVGRGAATLRFETEQQIDFVVSAGNREEWRWSSGYPYPKRPTTVTVEPGTCARWTVRWDATGNDGDPLRAGDYAIQPDVLASLTENGVWASSAAYDLELVG